MEKISLAYLTSVIRKTYLNNYKFDLKNVGSTSQISPIIQLSLEQKDKLENGDGQRDSPDQYKQINSSTGLAVNYYKILESSSTISDLCFEEKIGKPLKYGGHEANIDVFYKHNGIKKYIESKFLEPYYSGNEHNRQSYFDEDKYSSNVKDKSTWIDLFSIADCYLYYNFSQLCRHLLALYKLSIDKPNELFVLQSVTWKVTDKFIGLLDEKHRKTIIKIDGILENEAIQCQKTVNDFIKTINCDNISFETKHYNDMLNDIKDSDYYSNFCQRYFF